MQISIIPHSSHCEEGHIVKINSVSPPSVECLLCVYCVPALAIGTVLTVWVCIWETDGAEKEIKPFHVYTHNAKAFFWNF